MKKIINNTFDYPHHLGAHVKFTNAQTIMDMDILSEYANKYKTDKGTIGYKYHSYTPLYNEKWKDFRYDAKKIFEIGIGGDFPQTDTLHASSLKMLRDYFENAKIYGIDVNSSFVKNTADMKNIEVYLCDSSNKSQLDILFSNLGNDFDLIIDDGGHDTINQQKSFGYLFKYIKSNSLYMIEDLHTSIWGGFGLPPNDEKSCLNMLNKYIKNGKLESVYIDKIDLEYLNDTIKSIEIYDINNEGNDVTSFIYKG